MLERRFLYCLLCCALASSAWESFPHIHGAWAQSPGGELHGADAVPGAFSHVEGSACCSRDTDASPTDQQGCGQRCWSAADCQAWVLHLEAGRCFLLRWNANVIELAAAVRPAPSDRVLGLLPDRSPWSLGPRPALCLYFSRNPSALESELQRAYAHPRFGPRPAGKPSSLATANKPSLPAQRALLVSHGHILDGGPISAHAFQALAEVGVPETVLILGTNHRGIGKPIALSRRPWLTPLGLAEPNHELLSRLEAMGYPVDESGHIPEHSIENQLPFLQQLRPDVRIVPLGLSQLDLAEAERLAQAILAATSGRDVLVLATTDYAHAGGPYPERPSAGEDLVEFVRAKDAPLLDALASGVPGRLLEAATARGAFAPGMCGFWPALVLMRFAELRGFRNVVRHQYAVSTELVPNDGATGFASFTFSAE